MNGNDKNEIVFKVGIYILEVKKKRSDETPSFWKVWICAFLYFYYFGLMWWCLQNVFDTVGIKKFM